MIDMKIGPDERTWMAVVDIDEDWVKTRFRHLQTTNSFKFVRFRIETDRVNLVLGTPDCPSGEGTSRKLRPDEQHIVDLWFDTGLDSGDIDEGKLISFWRRLSQLN